MSAWNLGEYSNVKGWAGYWFETVSFSPVSTGTMIEFFGKASHAGEPENGLNPVTAMSELILNLNALFQDRQGLRNSR